MVAPVTTHPRPGFHVSIISTFCSLPNDGRLGVRGRRGILEGSHGPGLQAAWVVVRTGQVRVTTWLVRYQQRVDSD